MAKAETRGRERERDSDGVMEMRDGFGFESRVHAFSRRGENLSEFSIKKMKRIINEQYIFKFFSTIFF